MEYPHLHDVAMIISWVLSEVAIYAHEVKANTNLWVVICGHYQGAHELQYATVNLSSKHTGRGSYKGTIVGAFI